MKTSKKLVSLFLILSLALSLTNGVDVKASDAITVTLRVERDEDTLITPVQVTLTDADKKDYGIGLPTDKLTPLHALAKYMTEEKGATEEGMEHYIKAVSSSFGLYLTGISTNGISDGSPASGTQDNVSWMFAVDNTSPSVGMDSYELKDKQSVVFYGLWSGGIWPDTVETNYCYFHKDSYQARAGRKFSVSLKGLGYDENYNSIQKNIEGASIIASPYKNTDSIAQKDTSVATGTTDKEGNASLVISAAGTYVLSAYRKAADGIHTDISRPYAMVTVTEQNAKVVSEKTPIDTKRGGTIWTRSFASGSSTSCNSSPVITDTAIYIVNKNILYTLDLKGNIKNQLTLSASMNSVCYMLLHGDFLYIPLNGGKIQCIQVSTMKPVWESEAFGGQSLSTVYYHDGYLYAGTTTMTGMTGTNGIFYCLDAASGSTIWTYQDNEHPGGYYWSGAISYGRALYFAGDNGILISHSLLEDEVYDTYPLSSAQIRAGLTYDVKTDALYTASNDGTLYQISATADGRVKEVHSCAVVPGSKVSNCTSTPTIWNGRLYIGSFADSLGYLSVMDAATLSLHYTVACSNEVKSSPLVSTGYAGEDNHQTVYVYFSYNATPGGLYYIKDDETATSGKMETLFIPAKAKQYCMSSITAGPDGTLYYSNDSGTLFAVREVDVSSDSVTPTVPPAVTPKPTVTPKPSVTPTPDKIPSGKVKKPKTPVKIKVKKKKRKFKIRWKKKTSGSQTVLYVRYKSGKWKKKLVTNKTFCSLKKSKKKIRIRLRSRIKKNGKWYYSSYTKTYRLK
ncbi:MAG: PQQ-binding-like beta-propeller repeat protein [Lachnospiraceae bacterium]|nr:PQQ-binding-like beta-propeller repeat protein [Lachnospiraceae bacterium]